MATVTASSGKKKEYSVIEATSGNDTITVNDGNFKIYAKGGTDTITLGSGDNIVYAQDGTNTIYSGTGADMLYAGKGKDNFVFNGEFGTDVIYNANANDTITFGSDYNDTALRFLRLGSDLVITDNVLSDDNIVRVSNFFKSKSKLDDYVQNGQDYKISDELIYYASKGKIKGTNYNDAMAGSDKKDTLYGYAGNDILIGGENNDKIYSGTGKNTIIVNNGDGHDTLYVDKNATSNTLMFDLGNTINYSKSGKDLVVTAAETGETNGETESITVKNYFDKNGKTVITSTLDFEYVGETTVKNIVNILQDDGIIVRGNANKVNKLQGAYSYDNYIYGGNKNDTIYAGDADNRLEGGKGNDKYYVTSSNISATTKIFDTEGNDTYNVKSLDTSVYINDSAGSKDVLKITGKNIKYTMVFDVAVGSGAISTDSLFIVSNSNIMYENIDDYIAGGIEIADFFDGNKYGDGRIEKITISGKTADTTLSHFDEIRSNVATWLSSTTYTSAMEVFKSDEQTDIQSLISLYQGNPVVDKV